VRVGCSGMPLLVVPLILLAGATLDGGGICGRGAARGGGTTRGMEGAGAGLGLAFVAMLGSGVAGTAVGVGGARLTFGIEGTVVLPGVCCGTVGAAGADAPGAADVKGGGGVAVVD
jgi:hypothetical protein